jgi:hypothetical protein
MGSAPGSSIACAAASWSCAPHPSPGTAPLGAALRSSQPLMECCSESRSRSEGSSESPQATASWSCLEVALSTCTRHVRPVNSAMPAGC